MKADLRVYVLLDPAVAGGRTLPELAKLIAPHVTLVQLRDKHGGTRAMVEEARAIKAALQGSAVPLLINDRVDVALAAGADGVHIGQTDMTPADARRLLGPDAIIGLSCKSVAHAQAAPLDLIDYVAIGAVYATGSKDDASTPMGPAGLKTVVDAVRARKAGYPVCAIAGINASNAADVIAAGADGVSVISAVSLAPDPAAAARDLRAVVDAALAKRGRA
ncbi:MAG: thiamine phosphate synthase [Pseudolabrys sp.]